MMAKKKQDKIVLDEKILEKEFFGGIHIVDRSQQMRAGLDIPKEYGIHEILEYIDVTEKPQYVLWNNGNPVANEAGGTDCIAYLYLKDGNMRGWSI
jgi:hypothetical protein